MSDRRWGRGVVGRSSRTQTGFLLAYELKECDSRRTFSVQLFDRNREAPHVHQRTNSPSRFRFLFLGGPVGQLSTVPVAFPTVDKRAPLTAEHGS